MDDPERWQRGAVHIVVRQAGTQITSLIQASKFPTGSARASWVDTTKLQNNQRYTYAVRAEFGDETPRPLSGVSNYATISVGQPK